MKLFFLLLLLIFSTKVFATLEDYRSAPFDSIESYQAYKRDQETMARALRNEPPQRVRKEIKRNTGVSSQIEFNHSLYTYHFTNPGDVGLKFENKVSKDGRLINNPVYGVSFREDVSEEAYRSNYFFGGVDSIGSPIYGYMRTTGFILPSLTYIGFAYGGYYMNSKPWLKKGIQHTNMLEVSSSGGIVPIFGIELSQKIPLGGGVFLKINNLITPFISNHNVGIGWEY